MKTTKIYISIIMVALTTSSFGIHHSPNNTEQNMAYDLREITSLDDEFTVESWMSKPFEEVLLENGISLEEWMQVPFETPVEEGNIILEDWMRTPFEVSVNEENLKVEDWMTNPMWS